MALRDLNVLRLVLAAVALSGCERASSVSMPVTSESSEPAPPPAPQRTWQQRLGAVFTDVPENPSVQITELDVPTTSGGHAIWGASGRDDRGGLWFGIAVHGKPSAHLLQYDPVADQFTHRGDVVSQLRECGICRESEAQMKIHSKLYQADDGFLYFASMDETDEEEDGSVYPAWGGHLWRMDLDSYEWEHLVATKEALIAVAGAGRWVYALGYFDHVVYQYDTETGGIRSHSVGSVGGHISRNFIADARGHVYVPRVEEVAGTTDDPDGEVELRTSLVELDPELRELNRTELAHYPATPDFETHGIIAFTFLHDQSCVFSTHSGFLYHIRPPADDAAAAVEELGYFHPDGEAYASSLFTFVGQRFLVGRAKVRRQPHQWIEYDLESHSSRIVDSVTGGDLFDQPKLLLYGTHTRDDAGRFYVVGRKQGQSGKLPVIMRINAVDATAEVSE